MATIKHVTNDVAVWDAYRLEIADNGETGDHRQVLCVAPRTDATEEILYIHTNGDPVYVGWIQDGAFAQAEGVDEWLGDAEWLYNVLIDYHHEPQALR
jgi:hypothetical protein